MDVLRRADGPCRSSVGVRQQSTRGLEDASASVCRRCGLGAARYDAGRGSCPGTCASRRPSAGSRTNRRRAGRSPRRCSRSSRLSRPSGSVMRMARMRACSLVHALGGFVAAALGHHDDELVAAVARADVVGPHRRAQQCGQLAQREVADRMSLGVVDRLKSSTSSSSSARLDACRDARASSCVRCIHRKRVLGSSVSGSVSASSCAVPAAASGSRPAGLSRDHLEQPALVLRVRAGMTW